MPGVDVRLILIFHHIQNQLVFIKKQGPLWFVGFPKRGNRKNMGLEWNVVLNPTVLHECLIVHRKTQDSFKEVWVDGMFPMKSSANESYGKIPMVYNPTNQTTKIGKIPND